MDALWVVLWVALLLAVGAPLSLAAGVALIAAGLWLLAWSLDRWRR